MEIAGPTVSLDEDGFWNPSRPGHTDPLRGGTGTLVSVAWVGEDTSSEVSGEQGPGATFGVAQGIRSGPWEADVFPRGFPVVLCLSAAFSCHPGSSFLLHSSPQTSPSSLQRICTLSSIFHYKVFQSYVQKNTRSMKCQHLLILASAPPPPHPQFLSLSLSLPVPLLSKK